MKSTPTVDIRCPGCGVLLAKRDETRLFIRRGDLAATVEGPGQAALVCYRPGCRTPTLVRLT